MLFRSQLALDLALSLGICKILMRIKSSYLYILIFLKKRKSFFSRRIEIAHYVGRLNTICLQEFNPSVRSYEILIRMLFQKCKGKVFFQTAPADDHCRFGTRIDHVLANVRILRMALEKDIQCFLCDARNRVRLNDRPVTLQKDGQYGKYVSLFALSGEVTGLTLRGFCYPLTDYTMKSEDSIGVSNEIKDGEAQILFKSGKLVIVESRD